MLRAAKLFLLLLSLPNLLGCPGPGNANNTNRNANAAGAATAPAGGPAALNANAGTAERPPGEYPGGGSGNQEGGRGVTGPGLPANANAVTTGDPQTPPAFRVEPGTTNRNSNRQ